MKKDILKKKKTDFERPQQRLKITNNEIKPVQINLLWQKLIMYNIALNYIDRRKMYAITRNMQEK